MNALDGQTLDVTTVHLEAIHIESRGNDLCNKRQKIVVKGKWDAVYNGYKFHYKQKVS